MAGKRTGSELNQDNWNDYEPEEAGSFQLAPDEVLKKRVIKVAKRRRPIVRLRFKYFVTYLRKSRLRVEFLEGNIK